jgi:DNA uptake protein ComE-like DNA-binding protein
MKSSKMALVLISACVLVLGACSDHAERRARDRWRDVTGQESNEPRRDAIDLNNASQTQLSKLPGLTDDDAARIVANRPYGSKRGLLKKNVIGPQKYERIERYVYVTPPPGSRHGGSD